MTSFSRRELLASGLLGAGALGFGPGFWREALSAPAAPGPGPYGPLLAADANGLRLPAGFSSRVVATAGQLVPGTLYPWHSYPDGQATFATRDGGWVLVSNSEALAAAGGGASAISFDADARISGARRICAGTHANCAGGPTPWGTWLTCEEHDHGQVWECDPMGVRPALNRPAMGVFNHEAAAVDPVGRRVYLTEDERDGGLYRFSPASYPDLSRGRLEIAVVRGGTARWAEVPDPSALRAPTRRQVAGSARFHGGEGIWFDSGVVYFTTKGDGRVWALNTRTDRLEVIFEAGAGGAQALQGPDNLTVSPFGDLFVCEDAGGEDFAIRLLSVEREAAAFVGFTGPRHAGSEAAGVVFDPSGRRMYFSSQRAGGAGAVYEVTGPFRLPASGSAAVPFSEGAAGPGSATRETVSPAGLRVEVDRRRLGVRRLGRRGLVAVVELDRPGRVEAVLRTSELATRPGRRGSTPRPVTVTLARTRVAGTRTKATVRLRVGSRRRARLERALARRRRGGRRAELASRLVVQVRDRSGEVRVANVAVTLTGHSRRRRR